MLKRGTNDMRTMHLFAGVGGGLLADLIIGHTPIVAVECDAYACQVLRERAAEGWFPGMHVWEGDVRMFDPSEYTGKVDCIHAGFPCQDISVAGKQAGVSEGTRSGLYREVLRIADQVRPKYLFLENVAAILSNGLGTVLADLAAMGYDARWGCIRASDVGANHQRDRWFLLASNSNGFRPAAGEKSKSWNPFSNIYGNSSTEKRERNELDAWASWVCSDVAYANGAQRQERIQTEYADFSSSSWWRIEPGLGRVANGVSNRVGQLKSYGNAQVPLQAAVAWKLLGGE